MHLSIQQWFLVVLTLLSPVGMFFAYRHVLQESRENNPAWRNFRFVPDKADRARMLRNTRLAFFVGGSLLVFTGIAILLAAAHEPPLDGEIWFLVMIMITGFSGSIIAAIPYEAYKDPSRKRSKKDS